MFELLNLTVWCISGMFSGEYRNALAEMKSILTVINTEQYTGFYGRLWFLPCMFVSDLLFFIIEKLFSKRTGIIWSAVVVLVACSWVTDKVLNCRLPFTVDTAFLATAFLAAGYASSDSISKFLRGMQFAKDGLILALCILCMWLCLETGESYCFMYVNQYGNYVYTILAAVSGTIGFLTVTKWLYPLARKSEIVMKPVLWYSYNSLATFPVHLTIKIFMLYYLPFLCDWKWLFLVMLIFNVPIVSLITNYAPFMLGKFKPMKWRQKKIDAV